MFFSLFFCSTEKFLLDYYYADPYAPIVKSDNLIIGVEKPYNSPVLARYNEFQELEYSPMTAALAQALAAQQQFKQLNRINVDYLDSDEQLLENRPINLIAEESSMSKISNRLLLYYSFSLHLLRQTNKSIRVNQ